MFKDIKIVYLTVWHISTVYECKGLVDLADDTKATLLSESSPFHPVILSSPVQTNSWSASVECSFIHRKMTTDD